MAGKKVGVNSLTVCKVNYESRDEIKKQYLLFTSECPHLFLAQESLTAIEESFLRLDSEVKNLQQQLETNLHSLESLVQLTGH